MAEVTISSGTFDWYTGDAISLKLRVYAKKNFATSDNELVLHGKVGSLNFYKEIDCTVGGGDCGPETDCVSVPTFTIDSTEDGSPNDSSYTFGLYDDAGNPLQIIACDQQVPASPTPTTLAAIFRYNLAPDPPLPNTYYTANQVDILLAALTGASTKATDVILGSVYLSQPAAVSSRPVALGENDKRVFALFETFYLEDYSGDWAAMETAIGSTVAEVAVTCPYVPPSTHTVPDNITVRIEGAGIITPGAGVTFTIPSVAALGSRQYFSGLGSVIVKNAELDLSWWTGISSAAANVNHAFDQAFASLTANHGGILYIPPGTWKINNHNIPNGCTLQGAGGQNTYASNATILTIPASTNNTNILYTTDGFRNFCVNDLVIDVGASSTGSTGFLFTGTAVASGFGATFNRVVFLRGQYGDWIYDGSPATGWEVEQVSFNQCSWSNQTVAAHRCDTINGSYTFNQPIINMDAGKDGMLLNHTGALTINQPSWLGPPVAHCIGSVFNTALAGTCIKVVGTHNPINVNGGQDEGVMYYLYTSVFDNSDAISIKGSVVQSFSQLNGAPIVNFDGCSMYRNSIGTDAFSSPRVTFTNGHILDTDLCGSTATLNLCDFAGTNGILVEEDVLLTDEKTKKVFRAPTHVISPVINDGHASMAVMNIGFHTGISESKILLKMGRLTSDNPGDFDITYNFWRDATNGRGVWYGDQTTFAPGTVGFDLNGDYRADGFISRVLRKSLTASVNDYFLNFDSFCKNVYWTSTGGAWTITGVEAGFNDYAIDGLERVFINDNAPGGLPICLAHQSTSSAATNRFVNCTGADIWLYPGEQARMVYDVTTPTAPPANNSIGRWKVWGSPPPVRILTSYLSSAVTYNNNATFANTGLSVTVVSGAKYKVSLTVFAQDAVKGLKLDFAGGTAVLGDFFGQWTGTTDNQTTQAGVISVSAATVFGPSSLDGANLLTYKLDAFIQVTTGGTFILRAAQNAANASNTSIFADSNLVAIQMSNV